MGIRLTIRSRWSGDETSDPGLGEAVEYSFAPGRVLIGRARAADVQLPHPAVSVQHASLQVRGTGFVVVDEESTNGTRINGDKLVPGRPKPIRDGDRLEMGGFVIDVALGQPVSEPTSALHTAAMARRLLRDVLAGGSTPVAPPRLWVSRGPDEGAEVTLDATPWSGRIGRADDCALQLSDAESSREHARLERLPAGVFVEDLGTKNGLSLNGRQVTRALLTDRDELQIGATILVFEDPANSALAKVQADADLAVELPPLLDAAGSDDDASAADQGGGGETGGEPVDDADQAPDATWLDSPPTPLEQLAIADPKPPRTPTDRGGRPSADLIIYLLAGLVVVLSIAGIAALLRAG